MPHLSVVAAFRGDLPITSKRGMEMCSRGSVVDVATAHACKMDTCLEKEVAKGFNTAEPAIVRLDLRGQLFQTHIKDLANNFLQKFEATAGTSERPNTGRLLRPLRAAEHALVLEAVMQVLKLKDVQGPSDPHFVAHHFAVAAGAAASVTKEKHYLPTVRVHFQGIRFVVSSPFVAVQELMEESLGTKCPPLTEANIKTFFQGQTDADTWKKLASKRAVFAGLWTQCGEDPS